jgi:hypothetical protein
MPRRGCAFLFNSERPKCRVKYHFCEIVDLETQLWIFTDSDFAEVPAMLENTLREGATVCSCLRSASDMPSQ